MDLLPLPADSTSCHCGIFVNGMSSNSTNFQRYKKALTEQSRCHLHPCLSQALVLLPRAHAVITSIESLSGDKRNGRVLMTAEERKGVSSLTMTPGQKAPEFWRSSPLGSLTSHTPSTHIEPFSFQTCFAYITHCNFHCRK